MADINKQQEESIMNFVVEKHPNLECVTLHTTEYLQSDNLMRDILCIPGVVDAAYSDVYKLDLRVGLAFDVEELIEKVQDEITTYYRNQRDE